MKDIKKILRFLPETKAAFGYGSGIFQQHKHSTPSSNMLDLILVTDDPLKWHQENLKNNATHYSFLKSFGARRIAYIQEHFGAGVYFNTMLKIDGRMLKYGVVSEHSMYGDLFSWECLYLGGRLHKPVEWVGEKEAALKQALEYNLNSALLTSLLLLPPTFTPHQLYLTIASLSYVGDFRMNVGEDRNKVENIVLGNFNRFEQLYEKVINRNEDILEFDQSKDEFRQLTTPQVTLKSLRTLPEHLQKGLVQSEESFQEDLNLLSANRPECSEAIRRQLSRITSYSSWSQSIKSFFSAGVTKSVVYAAQKVAKQLKSM